MGLLIWTLVSFSWGGTDVARAFRTSGASFGAADAAWATPAAVRWSSEAADTLGLDLPSMQRELTAAAATWNGVACSTAFLSVESPFAGTAGVGGPGDGLNSIIVIANGWTSMGFAADAAATTDIRFGGPPDLIQILEADIYLNAESFEWNPAVDDSRDLRAVLTHELGHVLGLAHPCELGERCSSQEQMASLYPEYLGLSQRVLGQDDIDGLCFLYPSSSHECFVDADCERGICEAGQCRCDALTCPGAAADPCDELSACMLGLECDTGYCAPECSDRDCPRGWTCVESTCLPEDRGIYGESCSLARDCASGTCLFVNDVGTCSRPCDGSCPAGDTCGEVSGEMICVPEFTSTGGCSVAHDAEFSMWGMLLAMLGLLLKRTKRSEGVKQ